MTSARSAGEPERRWRLVELARMAGVSAQQVRNYIDSGLLPPAERTASGYRIFTTRHAEALVTVRQVAGGPRLGAGSHHHERGSRG